MELPTSGSLQSAPECNVPPRVAENCDGQGAEVSAAWATGDRETVSRRKASLLQPVLRGQLTMTTRH
jgi:hypothetical protein